MSRNLPANLEAERNVLGGVLLYAMAFAEISSLVAAEDFYHPVHRAIYRAYSDLDAAQKPIDTISVTGQMKTSGTYELLRGVEGEVYFSELTSAVVSIEGLAFHAKAIEALAYRRRLIETAMDIAAKGYESSDDARYFEQAEQAWQEVANGRRTLAGPKHIRKAIGKFADLIEKRRQSPAGVVGVPSGWADLDMVLRGFQQGKLYVIAARPKVGKSAAGINIVDVAAVVHRVPSLVFSLEMPGCDEEEGGGELVERMISSRASIDGDQLKSGYLTPKEATWKRLLTATSELATSPIMVDDTPAQTITAIRAKARRWRMKHAPTGKALIIVDYLQLCRAPQGRGGNREAEVSEISRGLKALAKELRVPVIALAQLNRDLEKRADKRPMLSDLRESGAIEQDADVVAFLYRDHLYNPKSSPREAEMIIAAHRGGSTGTVHLDWRPEFTRFDARSNA
jgi:replicative DNA helicase